MTLYWCRPSRSTGCFIKGYYHVRAHWPKSCKEMHHWEKPESDCLGSHYYFPLLGFVVFEDIAKVQVYVRKENVETGNTDLTSSVFLLKLAWSTRSYGAYKMAAFLKLVKFVRNGIKHASGKSLGKWKACFVLERKWRQQFSLPGSAW